MSLCESNIHFKLCFDISTRFRDISTDNFQINTLYIDLLEILRNQLDVRDVGDLEREVEP